MDYGDLVLSSGTFVKDPKLTIVSALISLELMSVSYGTKSGKCYDVLLELNGKSGPIGL